MAVPDWPSTYGYNLFLYPWSTWVSGPWDLFIEHGHRLLGALAGLLTIGLLCATWRQEPRRWVRNMAWGALGLVLLQGGLGGARVVMDERVLALIHGCVGPLFLVYVTALAVVTSRHWRQDLPGRRDGDQPLRGGESLARLAWLCLAFGLLPVDPRRSSAPFSSASAAGSVPRVGMVPRWPGGDGVAARDVACRAADSPSLSRCAARLGRVAGGRDVRPGGVGGRGLDRQIQLADLAASIRICRAAHGAGREHGSVIDCDRARGCRLAHPGGNRGNRIAVDSFSSARASFAAASQHRSGVVKGVRVWRDSCATGFQPVNREIGFQPVRSRGIGFQPVRSRGIGFQPVSRRGIGFQPVNRRGIGFQPVNRRGIGFQPVNRRGIGFQPVNRRGIGLQPVNRGLQPVTGHMRKAVLASGVSM